MSDAKYKLEDLIEQVCTSGLSNLDEKLLKDIKSLCKEDDLNCKYSYEIIMIHLNKEHSEIRHSAFQLIDCLFQRSHVFRELVLDNLQNIFELVLEINLDKPLPPPKKAAAELKKLSPKVIKSWHEKFADDYNLLDIGFNYLKNCKKVDFVSFSIHSVAQRVHLQKQNEKQLIFQNKKYAEYVKQMNDSKIDIQNCIDQLERCMDILVPKFENLFEDTTSKTNEPKRVNEFKTIIEKKITQDDDNDDEDSDEDDDFVEVKPVNQENDDSDIELRYLGFLNDRSSEYARNFNLELDIGLKENDENKIVIDIMRDLYKELKNSHLTKVTAWIKNFNLIRNGGENLKKAIELKNSIQKALKQFEDLKIPLENKSPEKQTKKPETLIEDEDSKPGTSKSKMKNNHLEIHESDDEAEKERKKRRKMELEIAPVVDIHFCAPVTQRVDPASHPLYQSRELDITETEVGPQLAKTTFIGKMERVKWHCRAPVKNGKLCPRMDRYKCPFHGKIVARNEVGEIVNEKDRLDPAVYKPADEKELLPWQDPDLIADINAATGKNIQVVDAKKKRKGGNKKNKTGNLTDISEESETPKERLERRLFTAKNLKKVGSILDSIERRLHHEKFHHNFNYAINQ